MCVILLTHLRGLLYAGMGYTRRYPGGGVGCRPHQEFIVGNVFDYLPLQHMVYGPVQNIRRDWEDGKYPAPCVDCISYQPNRVSLRYRIKSNYKKAKAIILRRAFI